MSVYPSFALSWSQIQVRWLIESSEQQQSGWSSVSPFCLFLCVGIDMYCNRQCLAKLHWGKRSDALHELFVREHWSCKVLEDVTGSGMMTRGPFRATMSASSRW